MTRKKVKPHQPIFLPVIDASDLDARTVFMLGLPGHRTAMGRSGLGYLATQAEMGYMQGLMLRWLFTGKFRTRNPVYLFVMFVLGLLIGIIPVGTAFFEVVRYSNFEMIFVPLIGFPYVPVGCALFVNSILSLLNWNDDTITGD